MGKNAFVFILIVLMALGTMTFGLVTSGAWFTDTAMSSGAILIAGSLDIQVTGGPLRAKNLEPGKDYTQLGAFCIKNIGTTDLKYRGGFEFPIPMPVDLLEYLTMKVERHTAGSWVTILEISGKPDAGSSPLQHYFKYPGQEANVENLYIIKGVLAQKESACYRLSLKLDQKTPDEQQGKSVRFVFPIYATQPENPVW